MWTTTRVTTRDGAARQARPTPPFALQSLVNPLPAVRHTQPLGMALDIFRRYGAAGAVTVLADGQPVGLILRRMIADVIGLPCYRQTIARENCLCFVSAAPVVVTHDITAAALARVLATRPAREPADPFVVVKDDRYLGIIDRDVLVSAITGERPRVGRDRDTQRAWATRVGDARWQRAAGAACPCGNADI